MKCGANTGESQSWYTLYVCRRRWCEKSQGLPLPLVTSLVVKMARRFSREGGGDAVPYLQFRRQRLHLDRSLL